MTPVLIAARFRRQKPKDYAEPSFSDRNPAQELCYTVSAHSCCSQRLISRPWLPAPYIFPFFSHTLVAALVLERHSVHKYLTFSQIVRRNGRVQRVQADSPGCALNQACERGSSQWEGKINQLIFPVKTKPYLCRIFRQTQKYLHFKDIIVRWLAGQIGLLVGPCHLICHCSLFNWSRIRCCSFSPALQAKGLACLGRSWFWRWSRVWRSRW